MLVAVGHYGVLLLVETISLSLNVESTDWLVWLACALPVLASPELTSLCCHIQPAFVFVFLFFCASLEWLSLVLFLVTMLLLQLHSLEMGCGPRLIGWIEYCQKSVDEKTEARFASSELPQS